VFLFGFSFNQPCSLKKHRFPTVHQHPVVKVRLNRICKNHLFEVTAFSDQV
jgi:hypothetical protein